MKILVVNLLRLGDVVMTTPVVAGLKRNFPKAQIHFLMNESCRGLAPLLEGVDKFHYFDRDGLQSSLGDPNAPVFQAVDRAEAWLRRLNSEKFDRIYNVTQNRLSGLLTTQIHAPLKIGMHFDEAGQVAFESPWFKYLNEPVSGGGREVFHYSDIFQFGCGLSPSGEGLILRETVQGRSEAESITAAADSPICIQITTSDPAKEWSETAWAEALSQFQILDKTARFLVLGGPSEAARISAFVEKMQALHIAIAPAICGLEAAYSLLKRSRFVVSLDTSIKHMASAAGVPVIEICLGPSDERKTGVYAKDAVILKPTKNDLPAGLLPLVMLHYSQKDWNALRTIAREFSREAFVFRTGMASDFWAALPMDDVHRRWAFESLLGRSAWKLYLQNAHKKLVGEYGTEGLRLKGSIPWIFPELATKERLQEIKKIEDDMTEADERLRAISTTLKSFARNNSDGDRLQHLSEKIQDWVEANADDGSSLHMLELSRRVRIGEIPDLKALRDLENHMRGYLDRQDIKLKLLRSIKTNAMESL